MVCYTALTVCPDKSRAEALALACEGLTPDGIGVFEVEDGSGLYEVGLYFSNPPDEVALCLLAAVHHAQDFAVSKLPQTDWVSHVRRTLAPVHVGRFFLYGGHDADKIPPDVVPLRIEAAMAFGTGHHYTTQGCLSALEWLAARGASGNNIADIGCGTAVLAMAAAHLWDGRIIASDIDEVALEVAQVNITRNDLAGRVDLRTCAGFGADLPARAPYDLIFANILKGALIDLAPDMARFCAVGGFIVLSGVLTEQADAVIACYGAVGFSLCHHIKLADWSVLVVVKN